MKNVVNNMIIILIEFLMYTSNQDFLYNQIAMVLYQYYD